MTKCKSRKLARTAVPLQMHLQVRGAYLIHLGRHLGPVPCAPSPV